MLFDDDDRPKATLKLSFSILKIMSQGREGVQRFEVGEAL